MRPELSPIASVLGAMQEDHRQLVQSQEKLVATARQIGSLFEALSKQLGATRPSDPQLLKLQQEYMKLQMAMQRENLVFTSVSNVLKTKHDTAKHSISNVR